ncbi:MAG: HAD-IB family phosphatase [bacterium]|nr:HAD-IB family phosphatase [bacterium]
MRKVAIFDVDGTIFRSSLHLELIHVLVEEGVIPKSAAANLARRKIAWQNRKGDYDAYVMEAVRLLRDYIKGVSYTDFHRVEKIVVGELRDRVYRFTRDLVKDLKKKDYFLLAISHSPKGIVDEFCKRLGFNKVYGMFYEIGPTERFTGAIADEHLILNKARILERVVGKEGLSLKGSVGVGDTESDIPFLEMVEKPICFNPNAKLYAHAKRNGWKVVVERKDVIYQIQ